MFLRTCLVAVLVLGAAIFLGAVSGGAGTVHPAGPAAQPNGQSLPLNTTGCPNNETVGPLNVCVYFINAVATNGVPINQSVGPGNDNTQNAILVSTIGISSVVVTWTCTAPAAINTTAFEMFLFGLVVYAVQMTQLPSCPAGGSGHVVIRNTNLPSYGWFLSGVYDAAVTFTSANGTSVGGQVPFIVKLLSTYQPLTVITIILFLVAIAEVYYIVRDFLHFRKRLRQVRSHQPPYAQGPVPPGSGGW